MTSQEIVARLKLKYKIVSGKVYIIIEQGMRGLSPRPATNDEIREVQSRESIKTVIKAHKKKPIE